MKKHWYYIDEKNERQGPMSLEELKSRRIMKKTMVWNETMSDWDKAENIDELEDVILDKIQPPPFTKENQENEPRKKDKQLDDLKSVEPSKFTSKDATNGIWAAIIFIISLSIIEFAFELDFFKDNYWKKGLYLIVVCFNYYNLMGKYFRKYLNHGCNTTKANNFLDTTVFSFIALYILLIFFDTNSLYLNENVSFSTLLLLLLLLVHTISFIGLALKLFFIKNDLSGVVKLVGASIIFATIYFLYFSINDFSLNLKEPFSSENLWYLSFTNLPYLMIILMFFMLIGNLKK
jgi:hypothetical protein